MCLQVKNSFSEVNGVLAPSELALFILDEIGCSVHCQCLFGAYVPELARNLGSCMMPKLEACEEG